MSNKKQPTTAAIVAPYGLTPDMFGLPSPDSEGKFDTVFITDLYMKRPVSYQALTMAEWFAKAHGIDNPLFQRTAGSQAVKFAIVDQGYNKLPLQPLMDFNNLGEELNQRRRMK